MKKIILSIVVLVILILIISVISNNTGFLWNQISSTRCDLRDDEGTFVVYSNGSDNFELPWWTEFYPNYIVLPYSSDEAVDLRNIFSKQKCLDGSRAKTIYKNEMLGPEIMDGGSLTVYYCSDQEMSYKEDFDGDAVTTFFSIHEGNLCE